MSGTTLLSACVAVAVSFGLVGCVDDHDGGQRLPAWVDNGGNADSGSGLDTGHDDGDVEPGDTEDDSDAADADHGRDADEIVDADTTDTDRTTDSGGDTVATADTGADADTNPADASTSPADTDEHADTDVVMDSDSGDPDATATDADVASDTGLDTMPDVPEVGSDGLRILVLGTAALGLEGIRAVLTEALEARGAAGTVQVEVVEIDTLLNFYHRYTDRAARLEVLDADWDFVVLADTVDRVGLAELSFEGARGLAQLAREAGAVPIVMTSGKTGEASSAQENLWRIGLGVGAHVVSSAVVAEATAVEPGESHLVSAACLYSAIVGEDASATGYVPDLVPTLRWQDVARQANSQAVADSTAVHFMGDYEGVVRIQPSSDWDPYNYMTVGSSSEAGWASAMGQMLTHEGLAGSLHPMGRCGGARVVDDGCLTLAEPHLTSASYQVIFARWYASHIDTIQATGSNPAVMPQIYDRHYDGLDLAGQGAIDALETRSSQQYRRARDLGLVWLPHHINFARVKHRDDSVQFTSDGTHALSHVNRGMAAMSYVSRTGVSPTLAGLSGHTRLAVEEGERTIRQLSTLSRTGATIADAPGNRVLMPTVDLSDAPLIPDCTNPQTACQDVCVDTTSDAAHCGACGMSCADAQTCVDAQCLDTCAGEVCPANEQCVQGSCEVFCNASLSSPSGCDSSSAQVERCEALFDDDASSNRTYLAGAGCLADGATPHCTYADSCTSGCVEDLWLRFDFDKVTNFNGLRYVADWHNKAPNHWELWVSDDRADTPDNGAQFVAAGVGQPSPWRCVTGESCADARVPSACCPNGRDQPQDTATVGSTYAKFNIAEVPVASGRHWYFLVRDTYYAPTLILSDVTLTCDLP